MITGVTYGPSVGCSFFRVRGVSLWSSLFRVQVDGDDQTVQTQDFSENEDQNHTDEQSWLLGSTTDTGITDDTDGETGGQTGESYSQTSTEMDEAPAKRKRRRKVLDSFRNVCEYENRFQVIV